MTAESTAAALARVTAERDRFIAAADKLHNEWLDLKAEVAATRAERDALQARIDAAYERLAIDEFGGSYAHDLESLIDYAIKQYLLVADSEAKAADRIDRLKRDLADAVSAR